MLIGWKSNHMFRTLRSIDYNVSNFNCQRIEITRELVPSSNSWCWYRTEMSTVWRRPGKCRRLSNSCKHSDHTFQLCKYSCSPMLQTCPGKLEDLEIELDNEYRRTSPAIPVEKKFKQTLFVTNGRVHTEEVQDQHIRWHYNCGEENQATYPNQIRTEFTEGSFICIQHWRNSLESLLPMLPHTNWNYSLFIWMCEIHKRN